ncbi:1-deoxy-D-xylulose-5-phosphate reductoisomerase [Clostridium subterminale]|uniref:1-deoxy-D-xylulose 5-phosphate reductoisomerase n=1 Tax=Clostridium subterminale TaxID=1550 RepID=A0ABP3VSP3_CLOSU
MKNISILGATGSIGTQALDIIRNKENQINLIGVTAHRNFKGLVDIIEEFSPKYIGITDEKCYEAIKEYCKKEDKHVNLFGGEEALEKVATLKEIDTVLTSVVGIAGLKPTIKAIEAKKNIALANKETLVVAGDIVMAKARENGVAILPVDSEHGAIFQCIQGNERKDISKIILTASGGPFRGETREHLKEITPKEALKHPKWNMGRKISIDSSTLVNKGLEVIEAHFLFGVDYDEIEVIVHPQSIVHSMVEYQDGSIIAQLGSTDMRLPIQYALSYPERRTAVADRLDFKTISNLTFEEPDIKTFRCLELAFKAGRLGGNMPAIYNGANEIAVELFLDERIKYLQIEEIIEDAMNKFHHVKNPDLQQVLDIDKQVREYVLKRYV